MTKQSLLTLCVPLAMAALTPALSAQEFRLSLEEPVNGATATGVSNIRGWAVATAGIDRVEIYIDGEYAFDIPYGGERLDVGGVFPDIEDSEESGFGLTFNYGDLGAGEHTVRAKAIALDGSELERTSSFKVLAFPSAFLPDGGQPRLSDVTVEVDAEDGIIELKGVTQGDDEYEIELAWSTASQSFQIVDLDEQLLPAACSNELADSAIPAGITLSRGFASNVRVDGDEIQPGSEFNFTLVNASALNVTVQWLLYEDGTETLDTIQGSQIAGLSAGVLRARRAIDLSYTVPEEGAGRELDLELVLSLNSGCFERDYELFDASEPAPPTGYSTTASGLQYAEIEAGSGERPVPSDNVLVHYVGTLEDGTVFDSSYARGEPAVFPVNRLIEGFSQGLLLMNEGATYTLRIPPELGYGSQATGSIPANSTLLFELTLLEVL